MWHKADWSWQRWWVYASLEDRLILNFLVGTAWIEGGLTENHEHTESVTGIPSRDILRVWPKIRQRFVERDGRWMLEEQWSVLDGRLAMSEAGRRGGLESRKRAKARAEAGASINGSILNKSAVAGSETNDLQQRTLDAPLTHPSSTLQGFSTRVEKRREESSDSSSLQTQERVKSATAEGGARARAKAAPQPPRTVESSLTEREREILIALKAVFKVSTPKLVEQVRAFTEADLNAPDVTKFRDWYGRRYPGKPFKIFTYQDSLLTYAAEVSALPLWERTPALAFVWLACGYKKGTELDAKRQQEIINSAENVERLYASGLTREQWRANGWLPTPVRKSSSEQTDFQTFWLETDCPPSDVSAPHPDRVAKLFGQYVSWVRGRLSGAKD